MTMKLTVDMLDGATDGLQMLSVGHKAFAARNMALAVEAPRAAAVRKTAAPKAGRDFTM